CIVTPLSSHHACLLIYCSLVTNRPRPIPPLFPYTTLFRSMDNLGDAIKMMFAKHFVDVGACPQCGARLYVHKPRPDIGGACPTCGYIDSNNNVKRTDEDWTLEANRNDQINYFTSNSILQSLNKMSNQIGKMKMMTELNR